MNDKEIVSAVPELVYFPIAVTPGQYTFTPKLFAVYKTTPVTVDARAGQIYYVELQVKIGHLQFNLANPDSARNYMTSCYRVDPKYARDARVVFDAPVSQSAPPATQPQTTETPLDKKRVAEAPVKTAQLYVNATPDDARVRIMNIRPKFEQGIALDSGRYHIEVASAGYETYSEWILLKAGEVRTLPVKLKTQAVVKEVQQAESSEVEKPSVSEASNPVPDKEIKAPARLDSEQKRIAQLLQSESAIDLRNGAKNIYYHHPDSTYLVQVAEQRLLRDYRKETNDRNEVDALAWLCKALAQSHDQQFSNTLSTVAESAYHRKVRSYAAKSLRQL